MPYPIDPIASSLYSLMAPRQTRSFVFIGDLYGIDPTAGQWDASKTSTAGYLIKLYENVPVSIQPTIEYDENTGFGSTASDNSEVLDKFYFHIAQPVEDKWLFVLKAVPVGAESMIGYWWSMRGNTQPLGWRAMTSMIPAKRDDNPAASLFASGNNPYV